MLDSNHSLYTINPIPMLKITLILSLFFASQAFAADLSGKLTVLKKNSDKPESSALNGLVYLTGIETPAPETVRVQTQESKQFTPQLLALVKGQKVQFLNKDRVQHNVFSTDKRNPFDLGRYSTGKSRFKIFNQTGIQPVYCDIHQSMVSYIAVLDNHYYAYTNHKGEFSIKDIPAGDYTLNVWHIYGGKSEQSITIKEQHQTLNLSVRSSKIVRDLNDHKNKLGRKYKPRQSGDGYDDDDY